MLEKRRLLVKQRTVCKLVDGKHYVLFRVTWTCAQKEQVCRLNIAHNDRITILIE